MIVEINTIFQNINAHYSQWINVYLVVTNYDPENYNWPDQLIFDKENRIHERYGAAGEYLYLIRPDHFVGFRSIPPRWDKLESYLKKIFKY
ncbi:Uncharacterised protein [Legionella lansingensis]|uniref:Uncharacterized protein n=2 Tax=Legionella lansingensis TaxID=45067 RepID=A0A0W0VQ65_9GAMM|nr:hypothetical protein Llan_1236 [Legionella lansingensis]SNV50675.1 Uncharacterised protein [Legionella lansingensis]